MSSLVSKSLFLGRGIRPQVQVHRSSSKIFNSEIHLQNSETETFSFQDKLPKQPISTLASTGEKLKRTLSALEDHPSFGKEEIIRLCEKWNYFEKNEGKEIDKILRSNDSNSRDSFVNEIWTNMYLREWDNLI